MVKIEDTVRVVSAARNVDRRSILSEARKRCFSWPRQEAMWLSHRATGKSLPQIGQWFKRDHTTVLHSIRAVDGRMRASRPYRREMALMLRTVRT